MHLEIPINFQMNKQIKKCRICKSKKLIPVAQFGNQYLTNFPKKVDKSLVRCPLNLVWCENCSLLQLEHTANFDYLYKEYWYVSGVNQTMRNALKDVVDRATELVFLKNRDIVIDIGSNDSTLLRHYPVLDKAKYRDIVRVGFEPAENLMEQARAWVNDVPLYIINNFFNHKDFEEKLGKKKAKIITACAVFYDLDDPNTFVADMVKCLDDDGLIIIQLNYLPVMLTDNTFDNVSHEHLEYYSLMTLENILGRYGLEVFDLELNDVNGGSIRVYVKKKTCKTMPKFVGSEERLKNQREYEKNLGLDTIKPYKEFAERTEKLRKKIYNFITEIKKKGKTVAILGASTRGNALLQACNLDYKTIAFASERNPMKFGHYMVGSWIPIISEEEARKRKPDYFWVLPWQFKKEIIEREKNYLEKGGKFIFLFPKFEVYGKEGKEKEKKLE